MVAAELKAAVVVNRANCETHCLAMKDSGQVAATGTFLHEVQRELKPSKPVLGCVANRVAEKCRTHGDALPEHVVTGVPLATDVGVNDSVRQVFAILH